MTDPTEFDWEDFDVTYWGTTTEGRTKERRDRYRLTGILHHVDRHYWVFWYKGGGEWIEYDGMKDRGRVTELMVFELVGCFEKQSGGRRCGV